MTDFFQADPLMRIGAIIGFLYNLIGWIILFFFALKIFYSRICNENNINNLSILFNMLLIVITYIVMSFILYILYSITLILLSKSFINKSIDYIMNKSLIINSVRFILDKILFIMISEYYILRKTKFIELATYRKIKYILTLLIFLIIPSIFLKVLHSGLIYTFNSKVDLQYGIKNYSNFIFPIDWLF